MSSFLSSRKAQCYFMPQALEEQSHDRFFHRSFLNYAKSLIASFQA